MKKHKYRCKECNRLKESNDARHTGVLLTEVPVYANDLCYTHYVEAEALQLLKE